jgi:hypothetical protein
LKLQTLEKVPQNWFRCFAYKNAFALSTPAEILMIPDKATRKVMGDTYICRFLNLR